MINKLLILLNSRVAAIWLLVGLVAALTASTFLPNEITRTPDEWTLLARQSPAYFKVANTLSTPYLVKSPAFIALSFFLFLSTLVCTLTRLHGWRKGRTVEFTLDKAFSFAINETLSQPSDMVESSVQTILTGTGWDCSSDRSNSRVWLVAQKGIRLGFWGSITFHVGLLLCFLAVPVSALTGFSGQFLLTEGVTIALRDVVETPVKKDLAKLPPVGVAVENLRGVYAQGKFKVDFGGDLVVSGSKGSQRLSFSVNNPVSYERTQFSLQQFGFSPRLVVERGGKESFDYFLNLRHVAEGDYFPLEDKTRLFLLLFPDFIQEGGKIGSKSRELKNPVLLVRIFEGDSPVHQGLVRIGGEATIGDYHIKAPELKSWVNLAVSREHGLTILIFGMLIGISGLFLRFLSNERRLTFAIVAQGAATTVQLKGYSRYYPAFLEKEVRGVAEKILLRGSP